MVNPRYKIKHLLPNTKVLCDSSAFQDIDKGIRLTPEQALKRQLDYRIHLQRITNDANFNYESLSIYDQMAGVDEQLVCIDGCMKKIKQRGSEETAHEAIKQTILAAEYYATQRQTIATSVTWIAQGVTPQQYLNDCTLPLLDLFQKGDYYGFGGFCIIGRKRKTMLPLFYETVNLVLPVLRKKNIARVHIYGVCIPEAITYLHEQCKKYGIDASTDSSAPEISALAFGKMYQRNGRPLDPKGIMKKYKRTVWRKYIDYNPVKLAHANVRMYDNWTKTLQ
jgi:hypothetical protein